MDKLRRVRALIKSIFSKMFGGLTKLLRHFWCWLKGVLVAIKQLWCAVGPLWFRSLVVLTLVLVFAYSKLGSYLTPNLTEENIISLHYLNEGWTQAQRTTYYFSPQGTELLGLEYQWFINLELPLSHELLMTESNMRGWGFIVDPGQRPSRHNPGNLPVGLGRHVDPINGREYLDIGCATCHTGELHYRGIALRVDGGQAVQSLPNAKRGEFITTLGASVLETLYNPAKWKRFAERVVGEDKDKHKKLKKDFKQFAAKLKAFTEGAGAAKYYPVEEGRGRTDAVGRIANIVFGYDIDEPGNYKVADAPASYPYLWDIWRFDWVQYTGFTNQAMARNVGESLGVLAPIKLVDKDGNLIKGKDFGQTVINIDGMHCVEDVLRKLKPPAWPEHILGKIDSEKAKKGKTLFQQHCVHCHGPHISEPYRWRITQSERGNPEWDRAGETIQEGDKIYRPDLRQTIWSLPWVDVDRIGTDPRLADNFINNLYDASKLAPGSKPVNAGDGLQLLLNVLVPELYRKWQVDTAEKVAAYDGLNVPFRIVNKRAYTSRPLHGVWATPPFLHNGSIPSIYGLLSPQRERPQTFYVGNREYDPLKLGYLTTNAKGSFLHDTRIKGNENTGHLFTDVDMPGRIGPLLSEAQRYALLEYIKIMGNPAFSESIGGDPLNWAQYSPAPQDKFSEGACRRAQHQNFGSVES